MNIVHLCLGNYFCEGTGYQENLLSKYHRLMGHDVTVIASVGMYDERGTYGPLATPGERFLEDGTRLVRLPYRWAPGKLSMKLRRYRGLERQLEQAAPDLVFIHNTQFMDAGIVARYLQTHPQVRAVADFHSDHYNSARNWMSKWILHRGMWRRAFWQLAPFLRRIYCITPNVRRFVSEEYGIPEDRLTDFPLGADDEAVHRSDREETRRTMREALGIGAEEVVVVHGGKLDREKGTIELLGAFGEAAPQARLVIFGTANRADEATIRAAMVRNSRIHYLGWLNSAKVYDLYKAADIACFPGSQSALWQQAIATGLPLVCKYWEGGEYLDSGGNVWFLPSSRAALIRVVLNQLIAHPNLRETMARIAMKRGAEQFSYRRLAQQVIQDTQGSESASGEPRSER
jgi:1,2-diacylglycerol 3-alpha-glucosyltransferase